MKKKNRRSPTSKPSRKARRSTGVGKRGVLELAASFVRAAAKAATTTHVFAIQKPIQGPTFGRPESSFERRPVAEIDPAIAAAWNRAAPRARVATQQNRFVNCYC